MIQLDFKKSFTIFGSVPLNYCDLFLIYTIYILKVWLLRFMRIVPYVMHLVYLLRRSIDWCPDNEE
ncbi:hypothetical protein Syun_025610 [Stephania yunnanensis]|uniref:Uncharacterized protein n=1 Tax=Stephania yunnanensis TaxID=152371 RepID=A0AAP0HWC1_9MAGN